jgi:hypothetical protein
MEEPMPARRGDDCAEATRRAYTAADIATAPRLLGVDVARFGDDASVIFPRHGLVACGPTRSERPQSLT